MRVRNIVVGGLIGATGILAAAGSASAAFVTMTLDSITPKVNISTTRNGGSSWQTLSAGRFNWHGAITNPVGLQGDFSAFCIELTQGVSVGNTYSSYEAIQLAAAPQPAASPYAPMGVGDARLISDLWEKHRESLTTANDYAAFQIAIWEIVYDGGEDLSAGNFRMRNNNTVKNLAQGWLDGLNDEAPIATYLYALSHENKQDMLVPTPGAAGLMGLAVIVAARRKRK